jgi:hypothetical protein
LTAEPPELPSLYHVARAEHLPEMAHKIRLTETGTYVYYTSRKPLRTCGSLFGNFEAIQPRRLKAAMVVLKLRAGRSRIPARRRRKLLVARSLEISCFVLRIQLRHFVYFGFRISNLVAARLLQNSLSADE